VAELSDGGSGCDATLDWWVTTYLEPPKPPANPPPKPTTPPPRNARTFLMSDLPAQCAAVLAAG
jgi:penicillin-insensitive murein endopeptidase